MTLLHLRDSLKAWWPMYGIAVTLAGALVLWGGLPGRVAKAEEQIDDLKGWAKELQGYTRAMQEQQQVQQPDEDNSGFGSVWWEQTERGEWYCTDGSQKWWPDRNGQC